MAILEQMQISVYWTALQLGFAFLVFRFLVIIYRLTFHPLASFPGPKLAALTSLYAASYDLPRHSSFVKSLPELHDKYGPIVRTHPNKLHIRDLDSYNQIFRTGTKFGKDLALYDNPIVKESLFSIADPKDAKLRKDMLQPYFSKAAIVRSEPMILDIIEKFLAILQKASSDKGKVVDLSLGFSCLAADITTQFSYQKSFGALDAPGFQFAPILAMHGFLYSVPYAWCFPNFFAVVQKLLSILPLYFLEHYTGQFGATVWLQRQCRGQVNAVKARLLNQNPDHKLGSSIFDTMLSPDLSKGQYTPSDIGLQGDACMVFVAGTDTTANALVQGSWRLMNHPEFLKKLRVELKEAIPATDKIVSWIKLQELPYLQAVIKETLRFSHGVPGQIPRIVPSTGATFCGRSIPPGTSVSHSVYIYHSNESLFEDAASFIPERWLSDDNHILDSRLLSFSRGTRACIGMNLAQCILSITFALLFRRYDLSPEGTTDADIEWDDCFASHTRGHLKVSLSSLDNIDI